MERHEQVYIDKAFPTLIQYFKVNEDVLGILTQREILSEGEAAILVKKYYLKAKKCIEYTNMLQFREKPVLI